jgi:hypothetical protein
MCKNHGVKDLMAMKFGFSHLTKKEVRGAANTEKSGTLNTLQRQRSAADGLSLGL